MSSTYWSMARSNFIAGHSPTSGRSLDVSVSSRLHGPSLAIVIAHWRSPPLVAIALGTPGPVSGESVAALILLVASSSLPSEASRQFRAKSPFASLDHVPSCVPADGASINLPAERVRRDLLGDMGVTVPMSDQPLDEYPMFAHAHMTSRLGELERFDGLK